MKKGESNKKVIVGFLLSVAIFCVVVAGFVASSTGVLERAGQESMDTLKTAITRASVQCYAIEGRYPPSVAYLEENYGIQIDYDRYQVFYSGFASNIMPDITVVKLEP